MKMQPMRQFAVNSGDARKRKDTPKIKPVKYSLTDRVILTVLFVTFVGWMFMYFASGICPLITGRCLQCVLTGNYNCRLQTHAQQLHRQSGADLNKVQK